MRMSASRISTWMNCSLQAHYKYDQGLPQLRNAKTVFGSIIHVCLQHYYESRGDLAGATRMFVRMWADPGRAGYPIDYWPRYTTFGQLMGKGKELLQYVHDSHRWQDFTVLATEHAFLVNLGEFELTGYVDLLGIEKSGTGKEILKIVDFKTAGRAPNTAQLAFDVQLTSYLYAARQKEFWTGVEGDAKFQGIDNGEWWYEMIRGMPARAIWWGVFVGRQIDAGPRTEKDFARLLRVCREIQAASDLGVHVPKIGEACTFCDFQEPCAMDIPVALKQLQDPTDPNRWI